MPNYKESAVTGTEWQRCEQVIVTNPYAGTPEVIFREERIIIMPSGQITQPTDGCRKQFSLAATFPLLNPETNVPTGMAMTHAELYVALYSLYMQTAVERDAAVAAQKP